MYSASNKGSDILLYSNKLWYDDTQGYNSILSAS